MTKTQQNLLELLPNALEPKSQHSQTLSNALCNQNHIHSNYFLMIGSKQKSHLNLMEKQERLH